MKVTKENGKEIEENTRHNRNPAMSLQTRTSEGRRTDGRPRKHDNQRTRNVSERPFFMLIKGEVVHQMMDERRNASVSSGSYRRWFCGEAVGAYAKTLSALRVYIYIYI